MIAAVLSMLHEEQSSAMRCFRDRPVLDWTLRRMASVRSLGARAILCWDDQMSAVQPIADVHTSKVISSGPRRSIPSLDALTTARRWADGWRGGPLQTCEFDRGFSAPALLEVSNALNAESLLLIDPSAGLVDPQLLEQLIAHADANATRPLIFSQAAPGLSGVVIRRSLLQQLATINAHPGKFIHYQPSQPTRDPISELNCVPVPTPVARTTQRFTLESNRQIARFTAATAHLNGQLINTNAEGLVQVIQNHRDEKPREISIELTTRRATKPIFLPQIDRPDLPLKQARRLIEQAAEIEDIRLTLGGVGDPLLAENLFDVIDSAAAAGIRAIHVRTDLVAIDLEKASRLIQSPIDLISIQTPAITADTYQAVMGIDALHQVIENVKQLIQLRAASGRQTPILIPVFTKCRQNLAEMETWYDKWLGALGSAVITGATDFAGKIEDHAVADMSPPLRRPCNRIYSRLHVLSDARIVPCEQDAFGCQAVASTNIQNAWDSLAPWRSDHRNGEWSKHETCIQCREWHRP